MIEFYGVKIKVQNMPRLGDTDEAGKLQSTLR